MAGRNSGLLFWQFRLLRLAGFVRLPNFTRRRLQRRQPTAAVAVGVDANEVTEVDDFAFLVGGVAEDGDFSGNVRFGRAII